MKKEIINKKYLDFIIDDFKRACELHKNCKQCLSLQELVFKLNMCISAITSYCGNQECTRDYYLSQLRILFEEFEKEGENNENI